jgi:hypothetical protein
MPSSRTAERGQRLVDAAVGVGAYLDSKRGSESNLLRSQLSREPTIMRPAIAIVMLSCALFGEIDSGRAEDATARKFLCIIEKAAGLVEKNPLPPARDVSSQYDAAVVNFEEKHKRFVLTVKPIVRDQWDRELCRSTLAYWESILAQNGGFNEGTDSLNFKQKPGQFVDTRYNIGRKCFASRNATLKFFDGGYEANLTSYDFLENEFTGLPGEWLKLYSDAYSSFEASLYLGTIVITGKCQSID